MPPLSSTSPFSKIRHLQHHRHPIVAEVQNHRPPPHQNQRHISGLTPSSSSESLPLILDLMDSAYSQLDDLTRHLDRSPSEITKDVEAFHSLLHESFKILAQAFQQLNDEVNKEIRWEKMTKIQDALKVMMGVMEAAKTSPCHGSVEKLPSTGNHSHAPQLNATLRSPKGFGPSPKKAEKTKISNGDHDRGDNKDDEDNEEEETRDQGIIPEVLTNRMTNWMAFSVIHWALVLPIILLLKVGLIVLIVSFRKSNQNEEFDERVDAH